MPTVTILMVLTIVPAKMAIGEMEQTVKVRFQRSITRLEVYHLTTENMAGN